MPVLQDFAKDGNPLELLMPMWSKEELELADSFEPRGGDSIQAVMDIYGPKPRHVQSPDPQSPPLAPSISLSSLPRLLTAEDMTFTGLSAYEHAVLLQL